MLQGAKNSEERQRQEENTGVGRAELGEEQVAVEQVVAPQGEKKKNQQPEASEGCRRDLPDSSGPAEIFHGEMEKPVAFHFL